MATCDPVGEKETQLVSLQPFCSICHGAREGKGGGGGEERKGEGEKVQTEDHEIYYPTERSNTVIFHLPLVLRSHRMSAPLLPHVARRLGSVGLQLTSYTASGWPSSVTGGTVEVKSHTFTVPSHEQLA